ncbi:hypothetical protein Q5Y75_07905 [Ruegeria sp. 2205SS24-7]|uniref:hypothetical protein n=1 Tax=Ruegeria discodermiae TaxID=3064389 RepID=UPI0027403DEA|nr:hypothetical protein [Ruegeria sp. 2205SS24-7]MDP5217137.1 hypothetical protein [Ruegeria sp. 2205SS24-7]
MDDLRQRIAARRAELNQNGGQMAGLRDRIAKRRAELSGEVIATTDDGGQVFKRQDGSLSFTSPGYATTDQNRIEEIMQGAKPVDLMQGDLDRERIAQNPIAARAQEFVQGAPLVGEWADEAVGMVSPQAAENMRLTSDAMERQHPGQSAALNVTGGIATAIPLATSAGIGKAADFINKGAKTLTRGLRAGTLAAPAGMIEGASSFAGRAEPGQRLPEAGKGAAVGGTLAALLGPVASMTGEGVTKLARRVKGLDVRTIMEEFGLSPAAARTVKQALVNDDLDAAQAQLSRLGDDAMLADAGPSTQALLDASANTGGTALRVAREASEARSAKVGKHITRTLDAVFGKPKGVKTAAREISQGTSQARQAAYSRAYAQPINYAAQTGRDIEGVLSRVPPRTLKSAISEANEAMTAAGARNQQILADIADNGTVAFREMPNVQQLDEIKKALDGIARESVDQFGRLNAAGLRARKLAAELREALKAANPVYGRALRLGGDKLQQDEALALGKNLLFKGTTVEDVQGFLRQGVSNEARQALRQGIRESIENNLSNVRRTITDPNVDAREAMTLIKDMSSRANREKLKFAVGGPRADRLLLELDRAAAALELRAAVAQNSKTAIRQSIQGQVTDEAAPGLLRRTAGNIGNPLEAARHVSQQVASIDPRSMSAREKAVFDEIAQSLVGIQGPEARQALVAVKKALIGQPLKDGQSELIGRVVANSGALGLYQSGKQALAQ